MRHAPPSALKLLEDLPGIGEVVWATVTRLASERTSTSVLFTAAEPRAGTSVLACATAIGLARQHRVPVCLLETSVGSPALAGYLDLESAGLSDVLDERAELGDCLQEPRDCPGLFVLTAGTQRAPVSGEFATDRLTSIIARLKQRCQYLIIDTAPVLEHVESRLLLRHADASVLVLRARSTLRNSAERALDILVESGTPVLGSIFNAYKSERFFGSRGRSNQSSESAVRDERTDARGLPSAAAETVASDRRVDSPSEREESAAASHGSPRRASSAPVLEVRARTDERSEAAHRRDVELLSRRIAKLGERLDQTEEELRRIAVMKEGDPGLASVYRSVQGLAPDTAARSLKSALLEQIFQANLGLRSAMAQHPMASARLGS